MRRLLVATRNEGKLLEFASMLAGSDIDFVGIGEVVPAIVEVEESGSTFAENARLKASGYARQSGLHALADDSGLEIAALGGKPGVHSARYGGEKTSFGNKIELLLNDVRSVGDPDRSARFVCALALADPRGRIVCETSGICAGRIAPGPRGSGGFGYDPIFIPEGFDKTFGELPDEVKHRVGHRGRAFAEIVPFLRCFPAFPT